MYLYRPFFMLNGAVKRPIPVLRFISLGLRRTGSTPHPTRVARLGLGAFYDAIGSEAFYDWSAGGKIR
jgi:hypothetical protein